MNLNETRSVIRFIVSMFRLILFCEENFYKYQTISLSGFLFIKCYITLSTSYFCPGPEHNHASSLWKFTLVNLPYTTRW